MRSFLPVAVWLFALVAGVPTPARADTELEESAEKVSLPQLFQVASRVAPALEKATFSLALAEAELLSSRGSRDRVVVGTFDVQRSRTGPNAGVASSIISSLTLRQPLPTNGLLEITGRIQDTSAASEAISAALTLRITQPLLGGFGASVADRATEVARHRRSAAEVRRSAEARSFAAEVVRSYWSLSLAWHKLEVKRASLVSGKKQVGFVEAGIRTGKYAPAELIPVQAAIVSRQQEILAAELDVIEQSIALRRTVGLEINLDSLALRPLELAEPEDLTLDAATLVANALRESDDLKAALEEERAARAAADASRRTAMPRVDLRLEGGPQGNDFTTFDNTTVPATVVRRPTLGTAVRELGSGGYTVSAGLDVQWELGLHGARGGHQADTASLANERFLVQKTRADIAAEVTRIVYGARTHFQSSKLGAKAVSFSEANVDAEIKKFETGKSSSAEIIRKQDELENARLRQAVEWSSYQIAIAQLDAASGTILAKYGLRLLP